MNFIKTVQKVDAILYHLGYKDGTDYKWSDGDHVLTFTSDDVRKEVAVKIPSELIHAQYPRTIELEDSKLKDAKNKYKFKIQFMGKEKDIIVEAFSLEEAKKRIMSQPHVTSVQYNGRAEMKKDSKINDDLTKVEADKKLISIVSKLSNITRKSKITPADWSSVYSLVNDARNLCEDAIYYYGVVYDSKKLTDADFSKESHQGFKILAKFKEGNRMHVIVKRSNDYVVGAGYDESDGTWAQGYYDFSTYDKALKFLKEDYPDAHKISDSVYAVKDSTGLTHRVVACNSDEAVKKVRDVSTRVVSDSELDKLIDWYTGLYEEEVNESLEDEGWERISYNKDRYSIGYIGVWKRGSNKLSILYKNGRAMEIKKVR